MKLREAARTLLRSPAPRSGLILVLGLVGFSILGPLVIPHDPNTSDFSLTRDALGAPPGPSRAHLLGTDALYRDVLARLAHGGRLSLGIAALATLIATLVGTLVGVTAGYAARTRAAALDVALMRIVDVLLALPFLLVVTAIGAFVGRSDTLTVLCVLGLSGWGGFARVLRAKTMQIRGLSFITAARALGAGHVRIVLRHVLPNAASSIAVLATTSIGQMMLAEAVLGYLSLGVPPPEATWGRMLHEAEPFVGTRLGLVAAPAIAILLSVLAFGRVGEALREALEAPSGQPLSKSRLPADLLLVAAALLLVAVIRPAPVAPPLAASPPPDRLPIRGGTLRIATLVNVRTLDPALAYDEAATALTDLVFARLVTFAEDGRVVPELARDIQISSDGRTYTFFLRDNVVFHDGAPLRAADVARSLERTLHPRTPCPAASHYASILGFSAFHAGKTPRLEGVRVTGDLTVEITLERSDPTFLPLLTLAFAAPVCPSSGTTVDAARPPPPCGAGPFRLASWEPEGPIRLARHAAYFEPGKPYLDAIEWHTSERSTTQRFKFERGALDYTRDLGSQDAALYRASPAWAGQHAFSPSRATNAIFMNTELPPFDVRAVRRAVALAIDPSVLEKVRGEARATSRVLPEGIPGAEGLPSMRRHDLAAALEEMRHAGYPFDPATGRGGYPHPVDYLAPADTFEQQAAEIFAQQLARIGIRVRLRLTSYATYLAEASRRRTTPMGWAGWKADFPDPGNFFEPTLSSRAIDDEHSQNYAFFAHEELDRVLAAASSERDPEARRRLFLRAEEIVRDEAPWAPTYSPRVFEIWQPYLRGYAPHPIVPQRFRDAWIDATALAERHARVKLGPASLLLPFASRRGRP
ncbi:ABC transporter substrate-binding protein [Polyangium spumosum]|uniref:ABC transporter substrate-binding protein n=1 Tax=Polyangium spumosum TaxID=889282 RepID=UPI0030845A10